MKLRPVFKYLSYFMGILAAITLSLFLIFKSWLDSKLESGDLDVTFINSQVQGYLNQNYSGLKFDFEKIVLSKSENQEISVSLEGMRIKSDRMGTTITAANTRLKNGFLSSIFGPISELFNGRNFNDITIYDPQIFVNLDILLQDLGTNLDRELIINEQNQVAYIDALEFGNQAVTSHHFYQNMLSAINVALQNNNAKQNSNNTLSLENGSILIESTDRQVKLDDLSFSSESINGSQDLKFEYIRDSSLDSQNVEILVNHNTENGITNADIIFKNININEFMAGIDSASYENIYDGSLSGRLNLNFNSLGRIIDSTLDLNIGAGSFEVELPYSKQDIHNIEDAYFSVSYISSEEKVDINEIQIKHDDFSLNTKGVIKLNYDGGGKITTFDANLSGLSLFKSGRKIVNNGNVIVNVDPANNEINFQKLDGELSEGKVSIREEKLANLNGIEIMIENSNVENVKELFSLINENKITNWFSQNVFSGSIDELTLNRMTDKESNSSVDMRLKFSDSEFSYYKGHPKISEGSGTIILNDGKILAEIFNGNLVLEKGLANVTQTSGEINIIGEQSIAAFDINAECELNVCVDYLAYLGIDPEKLKSVESRISGNANIAANVKFPTATGPSFGEDLKANIEVEQFSFRLDNENVFVSPLAVFEIENSKISSSGEFNISGIQSKFDILADISSAEPKLEIAIEAQPSPTELSILQPALANYITGLGRIPTEVNIVLPLSDIDSLDINSFDKVSIESDLTNVSILYPFFKNVKLTNDRAEVRFIVDKPTNDGIAKYKMEYNAENIVFELELRRSFNPLTNNWDLVDFEVLNLSSDDISDAQVIGYVENNILMAEVIAKEADLSAFIQENLFSRERNDKNILKNLPNMRLNIVNIDKVIGNNREIGLLSGEIIVQNKKLNRMQLDGFFNQDTNKRIEVKYTLQEENLPADLGVNASDAGAFLGFLGLYQNGFNGNLQLRATGPNINNMSGEVFIENIDIYNDKYLARLFVESSPSELIDINRVQFDSRARYRIIDETLLIDGAELFGQNVKFQLSGQLNNETGTLKLPGTYCPEYELNASFGTIPIFGPVLTGGDDNCMFSLPFQIARDSWGENTLLIVNPTGLLAPGIFRDAFDYD
ncbi:MAG: hypothetical protein CML28_05125 [Rhizobiales bacterium]|nr:hypothetical protein [Hyphomicrobiales bacterium]